MINPKLVSALTNRTESLFRQAVDENHAELKEHIRGSRILAVGAAGSIGSAFLEAILPFEPAALYVVDPSENALADLVRNLRASGIYLPNVLSISPISMGSEGFERYISANGPFDYFVNFAALKHVRSEDDAYGLMRMIFVNVIALQSTLQILSQGGSRRVFSVSTDKAVNPTSLMGATKRWMELTMFAPNHTLNATSARFANVAFSNGSLPLAILDRIARSEPIGAPSNISRYFVSREESGHLCMLAAILGKNREIFTPQLHPETDSISFVEVVKRILAIYGKEPVHVDNEIEALSLANSLSPNDRYWPCLLQPSDTSGEKSIEEFIYDSEWVDRHRIPAISIVRSNETDISEIERITQKISDFRKKDRWNKRDIIDIVHSIVPVLDHVETGRSLHQKI